ncbi:MAG: EI24 domain-containing protein [Chthonomonas sp.]|nr:EI24 domain-containing protein [Chthonomonas sp.]
MRYVLGGVQMVWSDRSLRRYLIAPFLWTIVVFLAVMIPLRLWLPGFLGQQWERTGWSQPPMWVWWIVVTLIFLFISSTIFFMINGILSGLLWENLSREVEERLYGTAPQHKTSLARGIADAVARIPSTVGWSLLGIVLGFTPFGLGAAYPNGRMCINDFTSPAYSRRQLYFPAQKVRANTLRSAGSYAWTCGLISLFPIVNLICLPGMIAGATMMVRTEDPTCV